jgi:hypothetical protein
MKITRNFSPAWRHVALATLASLLAFAPMQPARAQATTQVFPRQYWPLGQSNFLVLASTTVKTNSSTNYTMVNPSFGPSGNSTGATPLNATNFAAGWAPTFMPFSGAHAIGLSVQILNSNAYAAASNLVINVYPSYDTAGGTGTAISGRYGTNFSLSPMLSWSISYPASSSNLYTTNLLTTAWEPATALAYIITNAVGSNLLVNLVQSTTP